MSDFDRLFAEDGTPELCAQFGACVTYHSAAGGPERTVRVIRYDPEEQVNTVPGGEEDFEDLWVNVNRDPVCGIPAPQHGDWILFEDDPPNQPWGWTHQVRNELDDSWDLQFARVRPHVRTNSLAGR